MENKRFRKGLDMDNVSLYIKIMRPIKYEIIYVVPHHSLIGRGGAYFKCGGDNRVKPRCQVGLEVRLQSRPGDLAGQRR